MKISDIKNPRDVLEFMKSNIQYGWLDYNKEEHINNMENFRRLYRISSVEETLEHGMGTCIEQVMLMKFLLDKIDIPNKIFCTRVYENEEFNSLDSDVHMHCFILYYDNDGVHQIEHPNWKRKGIHDYVSEEKAIYEISKIHEKMDNGKSRIVTEFYEAEPGLSFKEFNLYINGLDRYKKLGR